MFGNVAEEPKYHNQYPVSSTGRGSPFYLNNLRPVRIQSRTDFLGIQKPRNLPDSKISNYLKVENPVLEYGTSFPANPITTGPGLWYLIHLSAHDANTPERMKEYMIFLRKIVSKHTCGVCRHHGSKYLDMSPPEGFVDTINAEGRLTGMFFHSWMFHNTVNNRLGKKIMPYQTAWEMFDSVDEKVCQKDCSDDESEVTKSQYPTTPNQVNLSTYGSTISLVPRPRFGPVIRNDGYSRPITYRTINN